MPYTHSLSERGWACFRRVCTLGFMRWGHRLCQYCHRVAALGTAHRLLNKRASLSMVSEESSQGQFASDRCLCIGVA